MNAELFHQVKALNPIPGDAAMPTGLHPATTVLQEIDERMTDMQTRERPSVIRPTPVQPRWRLRMAAAAFAAVVLLGVVLAVIPGGEPTPPATTGGPTTTAPATTSTTIRTAVTPEERLSAFLAAIATADAAEATRLIGAAADAEFLVATGWIEAADSCQPEDPGSAEFFVCEVTTDAQVGARIGDPTLTLVFEYDEAADTFLGWQITASQFEREYIHYGTVYDGEAFAAACPDPDFMLGPGRTQQCGSYLASIDALAAAVQPAVEPLDPNVTRINDVVPPDTGVELQAGENRFDRAARPFSVFASQGDTVTVASSNIASTVLTAEDGTSIEFVSPLLYAAPAAPLGGEAVTAPVPLPGLGGFEPWITDAGFATVLEQGEIELGTITARFFDIEWTEAGAVMSVPGRLSGDKVVEAGTVERAYVIDHPVGIPLLVFVSPGPGGEDGANATVEALLDGLTVRTSPVYP